MKTTKRLNTFQAILCITIVVTSFVAVFVVLLDLNRPSCYMWLFVLPLFFGILSIVCYRLYSAVPFNLGITILLVLMFVRSVISPLLLVFGNYSVTISYNIEKNTTYAIMLVCYEMIAIFFTLFFLHTKNSNKSMLLGENLNKYPVKKQQKIYRNLLFLLLVILLICFVVTPELMLGYRNILSMMDPKFSSVEDAYLVEKYGTTFVAKLTLVMGQYLMRIIPVFLPAYFMVVLAKKKDSQISKLISLILCAFPLFFIGGTIAKSIIYVVCLFFLYTYLYPSKRNTQRILVLFAIMAIFVLLYWLLRRIATVGDGNLSDFFKSLSQPFSAYFSGVNVVSGVFNLPKEPEYMLRYFFFDTIGSIPFSNTIFGIEGQRIQGFFNEYNKTVGQIPPTIGMGYYYLGVFFAPTFSILFTIVSFNCAKKLNTEMNPFIRIRLLLTVFYFSMGIIMYSIEIIFTNFFSILLPMWIIEKIAYRDKKGRLK